MSNRKPAPLALTSLSLAMILCSGCLGSSETQLSSNETSSEKRVEVERDQQQAKEEKEKIAREPIPRNEKVLALEEHENGLDVALLRVKRSSDNTVTLQWRYINNTDEEVTLCNSYCWTNLRSSWLADSYIVDNDNQKKHLVVKADGNPMTTKVNRPTKLNPGSSYKVWAKFPAPPVEVESVSIYIPGTIPIEDVRIEG
ncbi:hypothetical protein PMIT1313_00041 [Prochlorococcus marinus str. MIT 1313]|uniref:hypothetical protein n=1 Tax=Prochlorococcus TaxID=1218 RepID=UPI0007B3C44E|nr:hypothetical protein [Prochlorococcus marinus]KZR72686.1 hypothetical protein PMIT1313_00041 [Prochlorococcus marinus str. MIT 1313]KZR75216.1 hypothetical protein PMIT1318_00301 [Prochlorococcus marinus str. MIT 1318]